MNPSRYRHETRHGPPDINSTLFGVKNPIGAKILRFYDVTSRDFGAKKTIV